MKAISQISAKRFRALVAGVAAATDTVRPTRRIALADRHQPTSVLRLDLDTGGLTDEDGTYDLLVLDSEGARRLSPEGIDTLKSRLGPDGVIAIRHRPSWTRTLRRLFRRRADDVSGSRFIRGLPRVEAALLQSRLYVGQLDVRIDRFHKENWVIGSPAPLRDSRYRDQIGRVATDYLRVVGPILAGGTFPGV